MSSNSSSISFECQKCGGDFELGMPELIETPALVKCPHCGSKAPAHRAHALSTALEDLLAAIDGVRKSVRFEIALDSHELPEPYGALEEGRPALDFEEGEMTEDEDDLDDEDEEDEEDDDFDDDDDDDDDDDMDDLDPDFVDDDDDFDDDDDDFDDDDDLEEDELEF